MGADKAARARRGASKVCRVEIPCNAFAISLHLSV